VLFSRGCNANNFPFPIPGPHVHAGHDFVAVAQNGAKTTIDAIGRPGAFSQGNLKEFFSSLLKHIDFKSVDKVAIDLKGALSAQIDAIKSFVKTLTSAQQKKVIYVKLK